MNHSPVTRISAMVCALIAIVLLGQAATATAQPLLDPLSQTKYVNPLPIPARFDVTNGGKYDFEMRETVQHLGLYAPDGTPLMTTVWGYGQPDDQVGGLPATYPGPTFVAQRDVGVEIKWANKLPNSYDYPNGPNAHLIAVDPTLHMAMPEVKGMPQGVGIPTVVHLHGGHTESGSDGLPEAWFTQGWRYRGPHFVQKKYYYDNDQEAATLWYHDHALGITRLNVYAGLAGFYLLRDDNETSLTDNGVLPGGPYEVEIVVQDRMFTEDGQLFLPYTDPEIEPGFEPFPAGTPSAIAEFFGDIILVNGAAWPKLDVEPRKYRLRFLNGSDSRFYVLEFRDDEMGGTAQEFLQIGTDDGLLATPVPLTRLLLAPGERADLVVDFSGQTQLTVRNFGPDDPFKGFNPDGTISDGGGGVAPAADPATTGQIMQFNVNQPLSGVPDATVGVGTVLRPDIMPLAQTGATRQLVLFEGLDEYGRLQPLLGTLDQGSLSWFQPITENPMLDDVEQWEVYNATED
ncbi:MAG: multicopper oxidase domain-containing protein, partial [Candidatus Latescibacterota bacterium]